LEVIVKGTAADAPPPGFNTLTKLVPAVVINEAGTIALNCPLASDVGSEVVEIPEFHWMADPLTKLVPVTINWN
jgi:hypothetical protein